MVFNQRLADETLEAIVEALSSSCALPFGVDWNNREAAAQAYLANQVKRVSGDELLAQDTSVGGDSLRPYLAVCLGSEVFLASRRDSVLSIPRLLGEISGGRFGLPVAATLRRHDKDYVVQRLAAANNLKRRLAVPSVYLVSLTNPSRYQTRRYPLNIGRLAQWLRFQHAGRVNPVDLAQGCDGDIQELVRKIASANPDILGISLNFGEMRTLELLVMALRATSSRPILCVGNVLAAWAPERVADICRGFNLCISYSYGESALESLCRKVAEGWPDLLATAVVHLDREEEPLLQRPGSIVVPDERLLGETLRLGGQASIETSFGCQYSRCTFCPRGHRGAGWTRPSVGDATYVVEQMASLVSELSADGKGVLSIVDEDAFGQEGVETGLREPSLIGLVERAGSRGVALEIYTRLEQLFNHRKSREASILRLQQLRRMAPHLGRVFVGLESGCDGQLRRYAKGQTVRDALDALRAGSLLGLALEFGFITFDPLLSPEELIENIEFLVRTDVLPNVRADLGAEDLYDLLAAGQGSGALRGEPVFSRVAYMATELELFANSTYLERLRKIHPELVGAYDEAFARYTYDYISPVVGKIAAWCRVWTEGTFKPIYRMRLASRAHRGVSNPFDTLIRRYREATFGLLVSFAGRLLPAFGPRALAIRSVLDPSLPLPFESDAVDVGDLEETWRWFASLSPSIAQEDEVAFDLDHLEARRAT